MYPLECCPKMLCLMFLRNGFLNVFSNIHKKICSRTDFGSALVTHWRRVLRAPCFHFSLLCRFRSLAADPWVPILSRLLWLPQVCPRYSRALVFSSILKKKRSVKRYVVKSFSRKHRTSSVLSIVMPNCMQCTKCYLHVISLYSFFFCIFIRSLSFYGSRYSPSCDPSIVACSLEYIVLAVLTDSNRWKSFCFYKYQFTKMFLSATSRQKKRVSIYRYVFKFWNILLSSYNFIHFGKSYTN